MAKYTKKKRNYGYIPKYTDRAGGLLEVIIPENQAKDILATRKSSEEKKMHPEDYICDYFNAERRLLGYVVKVTITK